MGYKYWQLNGSAKEGSGEGITDHRYIIFLILKPGGNRL
jgi:hypothetical protein